MDEKPGLDIHFWIGLRNAILIQGAIAALVILTLAALSGCSGGSSASAPAIQVAPDPPVKTIPAPPPNTPLPILPAWTNPPTAFYLNDVPQLTWTATAGTCVLPILGNAQYGASDTLQIYSPNPIEVTCTASGGSITASATFDMSAPPIDVFSYDGTLASGVLTFYWESSDPSQYCQVFVFGGALDALIASSYGADQGSLQVRLPTADAVQAQLICNGTLDTAVVNPLDVTS